MSICAHSLNQAQKLTDESRAVWLWGSRAVIGRPREKEEAALNGGEMRGRRLLLTPIVPDDYSWLYVLATSGEESLGWRLRGSTPNPDEFVDFLWKSVAYQAIARRLDNGDRLGLVQLFNADYRNGHAAVSVLMSKSSHKTGWPLEAVLMLIDHAFSSWPLRKLYFESVGPDLETYRSALDGFLEEEGRLKAHEFVRGEWVDYHILALYREKWEELSEVIERVRTSAQEDVADQR